MASLYFDMLPDLPQIETLKRIASVLWARDEVAALWLGGSFARGEADAYSDLDLRVAVSAGALDTWLSTPAPSLIGEAVAGDRPLGWEGVALHHAVLMNGVILDLLIQSVDRDPPPDFTLVLGCRDDAFAARLGAAQLPPGAETPAADPEAVRQAIVNFWIDTNKHARVLHRGLEALTLIGLGFEQSTLIRLWHIQVTGRDNSAPGGTIHTLTGAIRSVMDAFGDHAVEILGTPRRNREEIQRVIEINRDEVARVGRELAATLGFEYPEELEQTVRNAWRRFLD